MTTRLLVGIDAESVRGMLRTAMRHRGMSHSELAALMGTHQPAVTRMLGGQQRITLEQLDRMAGHLGVLLEVRLIPREDA